MIQSIVEDISDDMVTVVDGDDYDDVSKIPSEKVNVKKSLFSSFFGSGNKRKYSKKEKYNKRKELFFQENSTKEEK